MKMQAIAGRSVADDISLEVIHHGRLLATRREEELEAA